MHRKLRVGALAFAIGIVVLVGIGAWATMTRTTPTWTTSGGVSVAWHREVGTVYGPTQYADGVVYAKSNGLSALDSETGSELRRAAVPNPQYLVLERSWSVICGDF